MKIADVSLGKVLTANDGLTIYGFTKDKDGSAAPSTTASTAAKPSSGY